MLLPVATVPHTLIGEVQVDGGHLRLGLADPGDRLTLLSYTPISGLAQLDALAVAALQALLADARARMLQAGATVPASADAAARPDSPEIRPA